MGRFQLLSKFVLYCVLNDRGKNTKIVSNCNFIWLWVVASTFLALFSWHQNLLQIRRNIINTFECWVFWSWQLFFFFSHLQQDIFPSLVCSICSKQSITHFWTTSSTHNTFQDDRSTNTGILLELTIKQECCPVGCAATAVVATTRCQYWVGGSWAALPLYPDLPFRGKPPRTNRRFWKHYLPLQPVRS